MHSIYNLSTRKISYSWRMGRFYLVNVSHSRWDRKPKPQRKGWNTTNKEIDKSRRQTDIDKRQVNRNKTERDEEMGLHTYIQDPSILLLSRDEAVLFCIPNGTLFTGLHSALISTRALWALVKKVGHWIGKRIPFGTYARCLYINVSYGGRTLSSVIAASCLILHYAD
jgi:hypothetical protein